MHRALLSFSPTWFSCLALIVLMLLQGCENEKATIVETDHVHKMLQLLEQGEIEVVEYQESLFLELDTFFEETFSINGYDHRLKEIQENWRAFKDKNYIIIIGSVAKSDNEIFAFVLVLEKYPDSLEKVYLGIGASVKEGEYPKNIIPYEVSEKDRSELQFPQTRNELKEFLNELVAISVQEIADIRKKQSSSNHNQFGWDVAPKKLSVAKQGIGLVWEREVINQSLEKLEAIKGLSSAHEFFDDYCNQDIVKGWMEDFGYHVQEQLYFGNELIYDEIINKESCERHLAMTASYNCEGIDTTSSSFIEGAEYCADESLYVDLGENIYLYENVTNDDWLGFKSSDSLGEGFHKYIKKKYQHSEKIEGEKGINDVN